MDNFADLPLKRRPYLFFVLNNELGPIKLILQFLDLFSEFSYTFRVLLFVFGENLLGDEVASLSLISLGNQFMYLRLLMLNHILLLRGYQHLLSNPKRLFKVFNLAVKLFVFCAQVLHLLKLLVEEIAATLVGLRCKVAFIVLDLLIWEVRAD